MSIEPGGMDPGDEGATDSAGGMAQTALVSTRKQARAKGTNRSKKSKGASLLLNLPVELLTEVMCNLNPIDILILARTCKSLRDTLMRRSSEFIWQRAAENLPYHFPPPPPWLNMPQFVSVVYINRCSSCGGKGPCVPKARKWDPPFQPVLFFRLCKACQPRVLISDLDIPKRLKPLVVTDRVDICSEEGEPRIGERYGLRAEVQKLETELESKQVEFANDNKKLVEWEREKRRVVEQCSKIYTRDFIMDVEEDRARQKCEVKDRFQYDVEKRLIELGWKHDICYILKKDWGSLTRKPRTLTDSRIITTQVWRNLYPRLESFLEQARSRRQAELPFRQQQAIIELWESKYQDLGTRVVIHPQHELAIPSGSCYARLAPPPSEAMSWPPIKQILDSCPTYEDASCQLREIQAWDDIRPLAETWQRQVESQLANRLQEDPHFTAKSHSDATPLVISGRPVSENLNVLLRADSVFQVAQNAIGYYPDDLLEKFRSPHYRVPYDLYSASPSMVESAQSFTLARGLAKALLQYLDPNATHMSLTEYGKRFVCGLCVDNDESTDAYDWKGLLNHYMSTSPNTSESNDLPLDPMQLPHYSEMVNRGLLPVHILSTNDAHKLTQATEAPWLRYGCLHCQVFTCSDFPVLLAHMRHTHHIKQPEVYWDYENHMVYHPLEAIYTYQT